MWLTVTESDIVKLDFARDIVDIKPQRSHHIPINIIGGLMHASSYTVRILSFKNAYRNRDSIPDLSLGIGEKSSDTLLIYKKILRHHGIIGQKSGRVYYIF